MEFAANNLESKAIACTFFFANHGYHPRFGFEVRPVLARSMPSAQVNAKEFADTMKDVPNKLKKEMSAVQARHMRMIRTDNANPHLSSKLVMKYGSALVIYA